jgi:hypothetical protein
MRIESQNIMPLLVTASLGLAMIWAFTRAI